MTWLAPGAGASLQVAPAVVEAALEPGSTVGPVWIRNTASHPTRVQVELVGLTHDPRGRPLFLDDPQVRGEVSRLVRPSWSSASLEAGEARPLSFQVTPVAAGRGGVYAAALVQSAVPTGTLRVAVLLLLGGPSGGSGPADEASVPATAFGDDALAVRAAWTEQRAPGEPVELVAEVFNAAGTHRRPRLMARIYDEAGRTLGETFLGPGLVLPGASRELRGAWAPPLLSPGRYRVVLLPAEHAVGPTGVREPSVTGEGRFSSLYETAFQVVAPYQVALVQGRVELALLGVDPTGRPALQAVVYNGGSTAVAPLLQLQVATHRGVVASTVVRGPAIAPGEQGAVVLPWPAKGEAAEPHTARVRWLEAGRTVAEASLTVWSALAAAPAKGSSRP